MIKSIKATSRDIVFKCTDKPAKITVYSPAVCENICLGTFDLVYKRGVPTLDRFITGRDGLFLKYVAEDGGVCYCSHVNSKFNGEYPNPGTKKGLQIENLEDAVKLGARHAAINVAITDWLTEGPSEEAEAFEYCGKTYYINKKIRDRNDEFFKGLTDAGIIVTLIMLSGKRWRRPVDPGMRSILLHRDYDDEGTLSAFNTATDLGIEHFIAWVTYLANRYAIENGEHGRIYGMIMSNEVQSQWIWGNAGEKTCEEFAEQYVPALRCAYLAGASVFSGFRVYISLDHFWNQSMDPAQPKRFYPARQLLNVINGICKRDGNFFWSIAHHPYPQDLTKPDFWNDETATFSQNTIRITFKNLEVLADWLRKRENMFEGKRRRIILSEQGFNSKCTPESEILQACAFGRAYRKIMEIPEIDAIIHYAHYDHYGEFGLHLGMWRKEEDETKPHGHTGTKPIYDLYKVIDTIDDTGKYVWERF